MRGNTYIKYFQSVVRNNSFSGAAEECHISQSAISQQIQVLEAELGFTLLERKNRKFVLTPAGEYFYQKSLVLTADYERMCRDTEREYYQNIVGLRGEFLYAENVEEARLLIIGGKGFMPLDGHGMQVHYAPSLARVPLVRGLTPIKRNYCAFWKKDNSGFYVEEFAEILKAQFGTE